MVRKILLVCGIASSVLYIGMNVFIPMLWDGYSVVTQTVSELSAIGAPTRTIWVWLGTLYTLLLTAFGWGVWRSSRGNRPLRVTGALMMVHGLFGLFWPPMHLRGNPATLTDILHVVWGGVTVMLMMLAVGFGAAAFGKRFRIYSIITLMVFIAFGILTGIEGPRIAQNLPTPFIGIWERINIAAYMLWVIALAVAVLRAQPQANAGHAPP